MEAENERKRGSDTLVEAYRAGGFTVDEALIDELATVVGETVVHDVLVKGLPAVDYLRTTFAPGGTAETTDLVKGLLGVVGPRGVPVSVRVFPRGLPWPGEFLVDVTVAKEVG